MTPEPPDPRDHHHDPGPFDIVGDVHGCFDELEELLGRLGYTVEDDPKAPYGLRCRPPIGRKAVFIGDFVDRGPRIVCVLRLVMGMVEEGTALALLGNHDVKLKRALRGRKVQVKHGLADSLRQLEEEPPEFRERVAAFIESLPPHLVLDEGRLVVAHAGLPENLHGEVTEEARAFALYGKTTGERDEHDLPVRINWGAEYGGEARVVYGHVPVREARWQNGTLDIDTGCVYGGKLTALRYPELELVSVPARRVYYPYAKPLGDKPGVDP